MSDQRFWRQMDICPPDSLKFPITVIGAGAIGSAVVLCLAKMGCSKITVFDPDALEPHNVPNQVCKPSCVGRKKVEALAELVKDLCDVEITPRPTRYVGQPLKGVVIAAVDNMDTRSLVWRKVRGSPSVDRLIDARMGAEVGRVHTVRPCDPDAAPAYEQTLYPSAEAEQLPCSARAIVYCPTALAAVVAGLVKRHALGQPVPAEVFLDLTRPALLCA